MVPLARAVLIGMLCAVGCARDGGAGGVRPSLPWHRSVPAGAAAGEAAANQTASAANNGDAGGAANNSGAGSTAANGAAGDAAKVAQAGSEAGAGENGNRLPLLARLREGNSGRSAYLNDLQRRADAQAQLAEQQRQELERLQELQDTSDTAYVGRMEELQQRQARMEEEVLKREQLLAQQQDETQRLYDTARQQAQRLDQDNRDLNARLAQSSQRAQLLEDQVDLLQQRLGETTAQLADARQNTQRTSERLSAIQASSRGRTPATITANNSVLDRLTAVSVPGMDIRQDFDLVRIALPADELFVPGTATLKPGAEAALGQAAEVVARHYPGQILGVEAHSDGAVVQGTQWRSEHQLTAAQAMAVFEQLVQRYRLDSRQLFVLGHGSNHPRQPSAGAGFEAVNRRIELVVYPERFGQR